MVDSIGPSGQVISSEFTQLRSRSGSDGEVNVFSYWFLLRANWRLIAAATVAAMVLTLLVSLLLMTHQYQATAIIRPVPQDEQQSRLMGGMVSGILSGSGMASLLGAGEDTDAANEYIALTQSFDFTLELIRKHKLASHLIDPPGALRKWLFGDAPPSEWDLYEQMSGLFDVDWDSDKGNLTLTYIDSDPVMARKILGYYIEELRDAERREAAESASSALDALRREANGSPDPMLQSQLYQLSSVQLEMAKAATAQSDFAFKDIQKPVVPDHLYSPRPIRYTALAGIAVMFLACIFIIVRESFERAREDYEPAGEITTEPRVVRRSVGWR